jgi:hypothetical protein
MPVSRKSLSTSPPPLFEPLGHVRVLHPCVRCGERRCLGQLQRCELCLGRAAEAERIRARFVH